MPSNLTLAKAKQHIMFGCLMLIVSLIIVIFVIDRITQIGGGISFGSLETPKYDVERLTEMRQTGLFLHSGSYHYSVKSRVRGTSTWDEIVSGSFDDVIADPGGGGAGQLSDEIGYFYVGRVFGVTFDAAKTWLLWKADTDLPNLKPAQDIFITDFVLSENGIGRMTIGSTYLHTEDFGKTWHVGQ